MLSTQNAGSGLLAALFHQISETNLTTWIVNNKLITRNPEFYWRKLRSIREVGWGENGNPENIKMQIIFDMFFAESA